MKRMILAAFAMLAVASQAQAQSNEQEIQKALLPLSGRNAQGAAVIHFNADGSYATLKEGTNAWVCYDRSGEPGSQPFAVQCTNSGNLQRLVQNRRWATEAAGDREKLAALVAAAQANGTRVEAEFGSLWISMNGADQASAGKHTTSAVPFATAESLGLPDNGRAGGLWIMAGGTSEAHLMLP